MILRSNNPFSEISCIFSKKLLRILVLGHLIRFSLWLVMMGFFMHPKFFVFCRGNTCVWIFMLVRSCTVNFWPPQHLNVTCPFFENLHKVFEKTICISIPVSELQIAITSRKQWGKQQPIVLEQIVITCLGIFDQFLYPIQEFTLKNDTLKNGTSHIGLHESAPPSGLQLEPKTYSVWSIRKASTRRQWINKSLHGIRIRWIQCQTGS